jgi:nicotinamidase-related amidase
MTNLAIDAKSTALVLIDLQHGIVGRPQLSPHAGADLVKRAASLAEAFREKGGTVAYVRVEIGEVLRPQVDAPMFDPSAPPPPPIASQLVPESGYQEGDLLIVKRQWGAFYGTDLDQQLRRRGIRTIVIGGIATNFGVESTARAAFDRGYALIFVEDAMTSMSAEAHGFAVQHIFTRMGQVRTSGDVLESLGQ